jgi:capsular exopolysaccharide synthesis family protein
MALFGMPFGLALAREMYVRRVGDADHLERDLQLSVIGEISRLPSRGIGASTGMGARRIERELVTFEESVDSLRTSLLLAESLQDMKVILVTSAISGEGKTSIAVQLAVSLARSSGKRTLLVDADMRSPDIHRLLDLSLEPGLADVLSGECSLDAAVQSELNNQLHVLTAGRAKMNPHRLVGNGTLRPTFDAFREKYDYVIIDTAPILSVSEALVLARQADASLICAMRDSSRIDQVRRAYDKLFAASGHPVGVVLNGVPTDHYYRRNGSYEYLPR